MAGLGRGQGRGRGRDLGHPVDPPRCDHSFLLPVRRMAHAVVVVAAGEGGTKGRTGIITAVVAAAATTTTITINATTIVVARTDCCLLLVVHNPGRWREGPLLRGSVYHKQQACEDYPWLKMTTVVYAFFH